MPICVCSVGIRGFGVICVIAGLGDVTRAGTALALPGVGGRPQLNSISIE